MYLNKLEQVNIFKDNDLDANSVTEESSITIFDKKHILTALEICCKYEIKILWKFRKNIDFVNKISI